MMKSINEPIAIVGIGCRYPGGVNSPESFWRLLRDEVDAITEIPRSRFDVDAYYSEDRLEPGTIIAREGGFLKDIDHFDAAFFGISPREANDLDPQQRLLLEVAAEAVEDAGLSTEQLAGSRTAVYVGMWTGDYEDKMYTSSDDISLYATTGGGRYAAAGRLSYTFDLRGPSMTVDTASSSSLVAIHVACQTLWSGEATMALVGGVNLILEPYISIGYSRAGILSPDARCKFGDARANGYVRSEGAGLVVLKPLSQALADGNQIYALIRGSAANNDGRSSGSLVAPGIESQVALLRQAYQNAGVAPHKVGYVEAHGTGTAVGDPIEIQAIGRVVGHERPVDRPCLLGSIKTNIGHTEAAAGVAGLIKVALCLKHGEIPASLHFQQPNPNIPWDELPLQISTHWQKWPRASDLEGQEPALASINGLGVTGTNAHLVLEEPPAAAFGAPPSPGSAQLIPLSAHTPRALRALAEAHLVQAERQDSTPISTGPSLAEMAASAARSRSHHPHRMAVVAHDWQEFAARLQAFLRDEPDKGVSAEPPFAAEQHKVVFVFPGQGSQWPGMGRDLLMREAAFREALAACEAAMRPFVDWSLLEQLLLEPDHPSYRLNDIDVIQPTLLAIEIALAELWRSWGVAPDAVIGHSMGEAAAAAISGALSLEDAMRVICRRSQLLRRASGQGAMAVVELGPEQAQAALAGYESLLSVAVSNSPRATVLSGDPEALNQLMEALQRQDIYCRLVNVDVASHSPQMDPLLPELQSALQALQPRAAAIPIYSTALGQVIDGAGCNADYWGKNLRQPVLFAQMAQQLLHDEFTVFIEMSPHPILLSAIQQVSQHADRDSVTLPSLRRHEPEQVTMLASLGHLYAAGYPLQWQKRHPQPGRPVRLPPYPWQRERFWFDADRPRNPGAPDRPGAHPLLSRYLHTATGAHVWETTFSRDVFPYLSEHRVRGAAVLPAAAFLEMALAAAVEAFGHGHHVLENFSFKQALFPVAERPYRTQLLLTPAMPGAVTCQFFGRHVDDEEGAEGWTLHVSGLIRLNQKAGVPHALEAPRTFAAPPPGAPMTAAEHYRALQTRGLQYGPAFQGVARAWREQDAIQAELLPPRAAARGYLLYPALLDSCFQLLVAIADEDTPGASYLPTGLERLQLLQQPDGAGPLWAYAVRQPDPDALSGDVTLFDAAGRPLAIAHGLHLQRLQKHDEAAPDDWLYEVQWQAQPRPQPAAAAPSSGVWLLFADAQGLAQRLAERLQRQGDVCVLVEPGATYEEIRGGNGLAAKVQLNPQRREHFQQLLGMLPAGPPLRGVVYLWSLSGADGDLDVERAIDRGCTGALHLVQALAHAELPVSPRLWLVTRGAVILSDDGERGHVSAGRVAQAPLWGLGGVIRLEHPELRCTRIDLDPAPAAQKAEALWTELWADGDDALEDQVALRDGARFVARLSPYAQAGPSAEPQPSEFVAAPGQGYGLSIATPGIIDNLTLQAAPRKTPGAGEVEIKVTATGLNFLDVMKALGIYPGLDPNAPPALGAECAGQVSAIGAGVTDLKVGDEVIAINPALNRNPFFSAFVTVPAQFVVAKPQRLNDEQAGSLPIAFLTAAYALNHLGRLMPGERVLIHSAAGGVGLAAVQLAQLAGAEVFATAGSPQKRAYLRELGIEHVMDSRSLDFAVEVMARTNGEGVDLVLNSLAGEAMAQSLAALAPYGRFLELGKRDIYQNSPLGLWPFQKNLSFFAIDLARAIAERPVLIMNLLSDVLQRVADGALQPLPAAAFSINEASTAFRTMAQAQHIGKIVLTYASPSEPAARASAAVRPEPEATTLITGGLGSLGLLVAEALVQQGTRHLALVGRSEPTPDACQRIAALREAGATVLVARADVAQAQQVAAVLEQIEAQMPPLRGIIHLAGLLADSTLLQMDRARLFEALAPKVFGAWHLHTLTQQTDLDFFVLFSSVASVLGLPGQGNYAAANAFLDALARTLRAAGRPALSINWGPWSDVGLAAARADRGERLALRGLGSIRPHEGLAAFARLMASPSEATPGQIVVMPFDVHQWCETYPAAATSSLLKTDVWQRSRDWQDDERSAAGAPGDDVRAALQAAQPGRARRLLLENHLREQVAQVLRLASSRVALDRPLQALGMDSLMALELRNRLERGLGVTLSATLVFNYPTVAAMVPHAAARMGLALEEEAAAPAPTPLAAAVAVAEIRKLSDEDAEALLLKELEDLDL